MAQSPCWPESGERGKLFQPLLPFIFFFRVPHISSTERCAAHMDQRLQVHERESKPETLYTFPQDGSQPSGS